MRNFALILFLLLFAAPAFAADAWVTRPGAATGTFACDFQQSRVCWWDNLESGGLDVTTVLDVQVCENVTAEFYSNIASANNNNTATVFANGNEHTIHATDLHAEPIQNAVLTGDPATSLFAIYGFDASFLYVRFVMNDGASTARISIHCHPRGKN